MRYVPQGWDVRKAVFAMKPAPSPFTALVYTMVFVLCLGSVSVPNRDTVGLVTTAILAVFLLPGLTYEWRRYIRGSRAHREAVRELAVAQMTMPPEAASIIRDVTAGRVSLEAGEREP